MFIWIFFFTRSSSASGVSVVVEQPLDGNYTGDFGEEASSSDLEQSSGSILPDDQERVLCESYPVVLLKLGNPGFLFMFSYSC